jgi:hypothetical protein
MQQQQSTSGGLCPANACIFPPFARSFTHHIVLLCLFVLQPGVLFQGAACCAEQAEAYPAGVSRQCS